MDKNDTYQNDDDENKTNAQSIYQNNQDVQLVDKSQSLYQNDTVIEVQNLYQNDDRKQKRVIKKKITVDDEDVYQNNDNKEKRVIKKNLTVDDEDVYHTPESEDVNAALRRARLKITALRRIGSSQRKQLRQDATKQGAVEEHIYDLPDLPDEKKRNSGHSLMRLRSSVEENPSNDSKCKSKKCFLIIGCLLICGAAGGGATAYLLIQQDKPGMSNSDTAVTAHDTIPPATFISNKDDDSGRGGFDTNLYSSSKRSFVSSPPKTYSQLPDSETITSSSESSTVLFNPSYDVDIVTKYIPIQYPKCIWGEWESYSCDKTCGDGERKKMRKRMPTRYYDGLCNGKVYATERCNIQQCPQVQCNWSAWTITNTCSKSCGGGILTKVRHQDPPNGKCKGLQSVKEPCNTNKCHQGTCVFKTGKYNQNKGELINFYESPDKCAKAVRNTKPYANGMTWDSNQHKCYAELGPAKIDPAYTFLRTCIF